MRATLQDRRRVRATWLDRRIDEALLAITLEAGFLLVRRRLRRVVRGIAFGALLGGMGAAAAVVGVGAAGVLAVAGWLRRRARRSAALGVTPS